jgi:DNA-directed RNA polymerase
MTVDPEKIKRQIDRENQSVEDGRREYARIVAKEHSPLTNRVELSVMRQHIGAFAAKLAEVFPKDAVEFSKLHRSWAPAFKSTVRTLFETVSYEEAAFVVMKWAIQNMLANEQRKNYAAIARPAADELLRQYHFIQFKKSAPGMVESIITSRGSKNDEHLHTVLTVKRHDCGVGDLEMDDKGKVTLGGIALHALVESTGLFHFVEIIHPDTSQPTMVFCATPEFVEWLEEHYDKDSLMYPVDVPMIVEPEPWTDLNTGGFLTNCGRNKKKSILRASDATLRKNAFERCSEQARKALDAIGRVPWSINVPVLEVLEQVAKTPTGLGGVPLVPRWDRMPPNVWEGTGLTADEFKEQFPAEWRAWRHACAAAHTQFFNEASARTTFRTQILVARDLADESEIFFCYNMDWRGRVYCMQNCGLSPQSDDISKGLLQFAEAKELGPRGWYWLKVHAANSFGFDKASFDDRVNWTEEHLKDIHACALDPLANRWWADADKPYQFLAACFEIYKAHGEGNPETYKSRLPIGMDASCSGSQHFSGLLRDPSGAHAVNLEPGSKPSDIYALVAKHSNDILQGLANSDAPIVDNKGSMFHQITKGMAARAWLASGVDRSWTKRNTMTMPYSASLYGFADQIIEEQKKWKKKHGHSYLEAPSGIKQSTWDFACARLLAMVNQEAIGKVVVKMAAAMKWFREAAGLVGKTGKDLTWQTPVGLRVVQRYRKSQMKQLNLWFGSTRYQPKISEPTDKPNTEGHKNGISPNFIHSQDAAHLMRVVLAYLGNPGKSLAVVHDCFATHGCNVDLMRDVVKGEFVAMYSEKDWLLEFYTNLKADNPDLDIPEPPTGGDFDINLVLSSDYFIS